MRQAFVCKDCKMAYPKGANHFCPVKVDDTEGLVYLIGGFP